MQPSRWPWLVQPLTYLSRRLGNMATYLADPRRVAVRRTGVLINSFLLLDLPWIREGGFRTVLDIGANAGEFSVAARHVLPAATLIAFEPLPECFAQLEQRLGKDEKCRLLNVGLGAESGSLAFRRNAFTPSSSFLKMTDLHRGAFPHTQGESEMAVRIERLDDLAATLPLVDPLLIKIDVQGYESHVIDGGEKTIRRAAVVIIETSFEPLYEGQPSFEEVLDRMRGLGFRYHGALDQLADPRDGRVLCADAIFVRE